jgi:hypothetical protein
MVISEEVKMEHVTRLAHVFLEHDMEYIAELALRQLRSELDGLTEDELRTEILEVHPDLLEDFE